MTANIEKQRKTDKNGVPAQLLRWYDRHARVLPWRARKGDKADPYAVWLSEVMLQQTTVATVGPYFRAFLARWPRVEALAAAPVEEVMAQWAGLGYYSRARNLHACAKQVAAEYGGIFPDTEQELRELPGIGPYTAAAIAAIAFDRPATVVDGNVERVIARLFNIETPLPAAKPEIRAAAETLTPEKRPGDYAQAMMDLGATICTPRSPACGQCPIEAACDAKSLGTQALLPARAPKKPRPTRQGICFWLVRDEHVWLRRRPEKGLLGGMLEVPGTEWSQDQKHVSVISLSESRNRARDEALNGVLKEVLAHAPVRAEWQLVPGLVEHTFTHFHLELAVFAATARKKDMPGDGGAWVPLDALAGEALPTVMRKVASHAMPDAGPLFAKRKI